MTDAEILRLPDVLGVLRQWESERFAGGTPTPAVLADKLQDHGYAKSFKLEQLRSLAYFSGQRIHMEEFALALSGVAAVLDSYDWREAFDNASSSPDPCPPDSRVSCEGFTREDVAEILHLVEGANDEEDWVLAGRLKDGRHFALRAGCDCTGWDCQAWGSSDVGLSWEDVLVHGLTDAERSRLGLSLDGGAFDARRESR